MKFDLNIIKWYPFENDKTILQIGENENISNELKKISKKIKVTEDISTIQEKFDYILIYGYQNNSIEQIIPHLEENGKLLIIGENDLGIDNWSKYSVEENGVQRIENHHKKLINIIQIKKELNKQNLNTNVFYVFPNYGQVELIINEKFRTQKAHIEKYCPNIEENEIRIFDEIKALKTLINTNQELLEIFANSYFIEASKQEIQTDIRYCSFNNCRKPKYRLITIIKDDVVEKVPATEEAKTHINNMKKTVEKIKAENIEILDYEQDGHLYSKLIKDEKTLDRILYDNVENLDEVARILNLMKEILLKSATNEDIPEKVKSKYEHPEELHFIKNAYWDMVAKNCFYINNQFIFFDQEWEKEYLPVEFIIYRSIINSYDLVRKIDVDELLEKLEILQHKEDFEKIDLELRKEIIDEQTYQEIYGKEIKSIDNLLYEQKIDKMRIYQTKDDNKKKQEYIEKLEEDNKRKQEYIIALEQANKNLLEEKTKKGFFWKGK